MGWPEGLRGENRHVLEDCFPEGRVRRTKYLEQDRSLSLVSGLRRTRYATNDLLNKSVRDVCIQKNKIVTHSLQ